MLQWQRVRQEFQEISSRLIAAALAAAALAVFQAAAVPLPPVGVSSFVFVSRLEINSGKIVLV